MPEVIFGAQVLCKHENRTWSMEQQQKPLVISYFSLFIKDVICNSFLPPLLLQWHWCHKPQSTYPKGRWEDGKKEAGCCWDTTPGAAVPHMSRGIVREDSVKGTPWSCRILQPWKGLLRQDDAGRPRKRKEFQHLGGFCAESFSLTLYRYTHCNNDD